MSLTPSSGGIAPGPLAGAEVLPLVLVPGFCCSGLEVVQSSVCPKWEGQRVWLGLSRLGFQAMHGRGTWDNKEDRSMKNKWLQHLMLKSPTEENDGIHLKPIEGVAGVSYLDPDSIFGLITEATALYAPVIKALELIGYRDGENFAAAPYDWRFAPSVLQQRDRYFDHLMGVCESIDRRGTGVVLLGHSMGNKAVAYFLEHVKRKPGGGAWLDRHVYSWIAAGAPHLGAPSAFRCTMLGDKFGLDGFVTASEAAALERSLSASVWLFPVGAEAEAPMIYLRRGGMLEVRNLRASVGHCGVESSRNKVMLAFEVWWGEGSESECLTSKSAVSFSDGLATFDPAMNFLRFGGPPELPSNATISVIVKEKGLRHDAPQGFLSRLGKDLAAGVQLIDEAAHGRKGMGVPRANTNSAVLSDLLRAGGDRDGFVDCRLPIASVRQLLSKAPTKDSSKDYVSFQMRWLDYRQLRHEWLGSQELAPRTTAPALTCHSKKKHIIYDVVEMLPMVQMEDPKVLKVWNEYYRQDPVYNDTGMHDCPPIRRVVSVTGTKVPTEVGYALRVNTARFKPTALHTRFTLDTEAELVKDADPSLTIEGGRVKANDGDGTVSLRSMDHSKDWSSGLDLKVIHLEGCEHAAMLKDSRFHLALRGAVTLGNGAITSAGGVSAVRELREKPPADYSIAGTWSSWAPSPMQWDGAHFVSVVKIGTQAWESFQILLRGSWDTTIYPSVKNASPAVEHQLRGPDNKNKGFDWTIGRSGIHPLGIGAITPGTEFKVLLAVDDRGRAQSVTWELHISVESFSAKAAAPGATACRWQAAKNDREWWDCPEEVSQQLNAAQAAGTSTVQATLGRFNYEFDLVKMSQRNLSTGTSRLLRAVRA